LDQRLWFGDIYDADAGMSKLPLNKFKCRQFSAAGNLNILDRYGPSRPSDFGGTAGQRLRSTR
jgi:hypothetical protein